MMSKPVIWVRALIFNFLFLAITVFMTVLGIPTLFLGRRASLLTTRVWSWLVIKALRIAVGTRVEVRGWENLPPGGVVIAAKHQSAFDTVVWLGLLARPAYVMKKELLRVPLYGEYARIAGMIPVDRAGGGAALKAMLRDATAAVAEIFQVLELEPYAHLLPGRLSRAWSRRVALARHQQGQPVEKQVE